MSSITFTVLRLGLLSKSFSSRFCLRFRGGNEERNGIYSSPTEVISDAIFVYPLRGTLARVKRDAQFVLKIAHLAISMEPTSLLEKISSFLPQLSMKVLLFLQVRL